MCAYVSFLDLPCQLSIYIEIKQKKTKPDTVCDIVTSKKDGKFIVFSTWSDGFAAIKRTLDKASINHRIHKQALYQLV